MSLLSLVAAASHLSDWNDKVILSSIEHVGIPVLAGFDGSEDDGDT